MAGTGDARLRLHEQVKEDWIRHRRAFWSPGFQALAVQRLGHRARGVQGVKGRVARGVHGVLYVVVRNLYGIELPASTTVGRRLLIGHQHGIVIDPNVVIGDDCVIRHNVTIGTGIADSAVPRLGDRVFIGPGAVIIGDITIGSNVRIGPNALVMENVPSGASAIAMPSRILRLSAVDTDGEHAPGGHRASSQGGT